MIIFSTKFEKLVYGNWRRHATQSSINQTGMDFVTEISFSKTPVVDETRLGATTECRATSDHLFYMCQNLFKNEA